MFNVKDQVVVRERVNRTGPATSSVKVGTIMSVGDSELMVAFPLPGGRSLKRIVPVQSCEPVTDVFRRNSVQINPAFRQIYKGSV